MGNMQTEILKAIATDGNLKNYEEARVSFDWADVEKQFSWYTTGKVNMAYEAIDRHVEAGLQDKVALYYSDATRDEAVTYGQMKANSNKFGNVLRKLGIGKGDRVFIFMPRTPELYYALLGTIKIGAIAGPLFEAFMEQAVRDRLEDAEAAAIVTTPALLGRVPVSSL
ncbi:AMP-binding protein, partial [Paenibacillus sp. GYB004]